MGVILAFSVVAAQPARGEVDLDIEASVVPGAPAEVVLTASVSEDETIIAYDWANLPTPDRCRSRTCRLESELAACRWIEAEVTSIRGDIGSAEAQVCVADDEGEAPRAELVVELEGTKTRVTPRAEPGTDEVLFTRFWVDAAGPFEDGRSIEIDVAEGCHVVDVVVADVLGRVGFLSRRFCGEASPRAWIGLSALCPRVDATQRFCVEVDHPLGLEVETSSISDLPVDCDAVRAPGVLERRLFVGEDERGQRVFASAFECGSGRGGRLMFASAPSQTAATYGSRFTLTPKVYGGRPPFTAIASGAEVLEVDDRARIQMVAPATFKRDHTTDVTVTLIDTDRLTATFTTTLRLGGDPDPGYTTSDNGAGCTATRGSDGAALLLLAGALWLARRRR